MKMIRFISEARTELKKVSWTPLPELRETSFVVLVSVLLLSTYIGFVDFLLTKVLEVVIK